MTANSQSSRLKDHYLTIKLAMVTVVGLIFLLASFWLNSSIGDRKVLLHKAQEDIAVSWAGPQTIIGPVLIIPYTDHLKKDQLGRLVFLPDELSANGVISPEIRHRGIFDVLVYQAELEINCKFQLRKQSKIADKTIHWDQAKVAIFIKDVKGLHKVALQINNSDIPVQAGSTILQNNLKGIHAPLTLINQSEPIDLRLNIQMKGSNSLNFLPSAKENKVELRANWPDPSFTGQFLPNTKKITKQGFQAQWLVTSLASSLPEYLDVEDLNHGMFDQTLGVRFLKAADHYKQAERTTKYSFLFVLYTFLVFFLYEVVRKT